MCTCATYVCIRLCRPHRGSFSRIWQSHVDLQLCKCSEAIKYKTCTHAPKTWR